MFTAEGRHKLYSHLLHTVCHGGVVGLLVHSVKNEVDTALKVTGQGLGGRNSNYFVGLSNFQKRYYIHPRVDLLLIHPIARCVSFIIITCALIDNAYIKISIIPKNNVCFFLANLGTL